MRHRGVAVRLTPWRGDPEHAVQATVSPGSTSPSAEAIRQVLAAAAEEGFTEVLTAALGPHDAEPFERAGFTVRSRLHLLVHDLHHLPTASGAPPVRRVRRVEWPHLAAVDEAAFPPFWHLDVAGIADALDATPSSRLRAVDAPGGAGAAVGYAASGRAGQRGYLQRLAVHPSAQRLGLGRVLALDALRWMRRRGVARGYVNTQVGNDAAVALYESLGFVHEPEGLVVLGRAVADPGGAG